MKQIPVCQLCGAKGKECDEYNNGKYLPRIKCSNRSCILNKVKATLNQWTKAPPTIHNLQKMLEGSFKNVEKLMPTKTCYRFDDLGCSETHPRTESYTIGEELNWSGKRYIVDKVYYVEHILLKPKEESVIEELITEDVQSDEEIKQDKENWKLWKRIKERMQKFIKRWDNLDEYNGSDSL